MMSKGLQNKSKNISEMVLAVIEGKVVQAQMDSGDIYADMTPRCLLDPNYMHWSWRIKPDDSQVAFELYVNKLPNLNVNMQESFYAGWNAAINFINLEGDANDE